MCAVCGHAVERAHRDHDIFTDTYTFFVCCHGEVEAVDISAEALKGAYPMTMGRAFERPRALLVEALDTETGP
jgi:hypothetical protein